MKKIYLLLLFSIWFNLSTFAQIKGKIFALPDSLPITNAVIKTVNGKSTYTDASGVFSLNLPAGKQTITVTHLAYLPQSLDLVTPTTKPIYLYLTPISNTLDEVTVNTGYQLIPKDRSTGSFTVISSDKLNEQVGFNVLSRLDGVASGFSTDRKTNNSGIMIRGLSSISGPRSPLIVLDNFPYDGNLDNLNPNDVENITILKDASAASIWGARAGNGVIVITTKKAKFNTPLQIQANTFLQVGDMPNPDKLRNIGVNDFISTERFLFTKGYYTPTENATNKLPLSPVVELLIAQRDGKITPSALESSISNIAAYSLNQQYHDLMYNPALNQQYSLNLLSGTEKANWNLSLAYDQNRNALESTYKRFTIKSAQAFRFNTALTLNTQFFYTRSSALSGKPDITDLSTINGKLPPYSRIADDYGNAIALIKDYRLPYLNSSETAGLLDWNYYPLTDYKYNRATTTIADLIGSTALKYTIVQGLDLALSYQYQQQQTEGSNLQQIESYNTRNLINNFTQFVGASIKRPIPLGDIFRRSNNTLNLHQLRLQSNYNKTIGRHNVTFLAGVELRSSDSYNTANTSYGYDANLLKSSTVDYANTYPNFITGSNNYIPNGESFAKTINHFISFYTNGAYTFNQRYTLSASARRDASNIFGLNTNDKWTPLWSLGFAWKISDEPFYNLATLPVLKLRSSYGLSGNVDPNMSALTTISYLSVSPYTQLAFANYAAYSNPELRWERSAMLNLALDFNTVNNRLSGSIEYFHKKGSGLYGNEQIDYTTGIGNTITKNAAAMQGNGFDINLNSQNLIGKIRWQSDFFLNIYKDKITSYYLTSQQGSNFLRGDISISGKEGYPVYSLFSYKWAGLNPLNGNPRGYVNGQLSEDYVNLTGPAVKIDDLQYAGTAMPIYTMALGNTISFGALSLNFRLSAKFGYFFRRESTSYIDLFTNRIGSIDFANRWQLTGDETHTNVPSMVYPANGNRDAFYLGSEATVSKGDHIRIQYVNLKYNIKLKGSKSPKLEIYLNASNLGILWQADPNGIDPDYLQYPPSKNYSIGLRANL
jgi:TonB-linked SusC/RagA family outer membrane protein